MINDEIALDDVESEDVQGCNMTFEEYIVKVCRRPVSKSPMNESSEPLIASRSYLPAWVSPEEAICNGFEIG